MHKSHSSIVAIATLGYIAANVQAADFQQCGTVTFDPNQFKCLDDELLCPVMPNRNVMRCGQTCYYRADYICQNGKLINTRFQDYPFVLTVDSPNTELHGKGVRACKGRFWVEDGSPCQECQQQDIDSSQRVHDAKKGSANSDAKVLNAFGKFMKYFTGDSSTTITPTVPMGDSYTKKIPTPPTTNRHAYQKTAIPRRKVGLPFLVARSKNAPSLQFESNSDHPGYVMIGQTTVTDSRTLSVPNQRMGVVSFDLMDLSSEKETSLSEISSNQATPTSTLIQNKMSQIENAVTPTKSELANIDPPNPSTNMLAFGVLSTGSPQAESKQADEISPEPTLPDAFPDTLENIVKMNRVQFSSFPTLPFLNPSIDLSVSSSSSEITWSVSIMPGKKVESAVSVGETTTPEVQQTSITTVSKQKSTMMPANSLEQSPILDCPLSPTEQKPLPTQSSNPIPLTASTQNPDNLASLNIEQSTRMTIMTTMSSTMERNRVWPSMRFPSGNRARLMQKSTLVPTIWRVLSRPKTKQGPICRFGTDTVFQQGFEMTNQDPLFPQYYYICPDGALCYNSATTPACSEDSWACRQGVPDGSLFEHFGGQAGEPIFHHDGDVWMACSSTSPDGEGSSFIIYNNKRSPETKLGNTSRFRALCLSVKLRIRPFIAGNPPYHYA